MKNVLIIDDINLHNPFADETKRFVLNVDEIAYIELDYEENNFIVDRIVLKGTKGINFYVSKSFKLLDKLGNLGVRYSR